MVGQIANYSAEIIDAYACSRTSGAGLLVGVAVWLWWGLDSASEGKSNLKRVLLAATVPLFFSVFNLGTLLDPNCLRFHTIAALVLLLGPAIGITSFAFLRIYKRLKEDRNSSSS